MRFSLVFRFGLQLVLFSTGFSAYGETALVSSIDEKPPAAIQHGINAVENALVEFGWDVSLKNGLGLKRPLEHDLEVICAVSNQALDTQMENSSIPSYEVPQQPESYTLLTVPLGSRLRIYIIGSDASGIMYGMYDLADLIIDAQTSGNTSLTIQPLKRSPSIMKRGISLIVHTQALSDRFSWFHSDAYWNGFIKQLSRNRFNSLELHGAYDIELSRYFNFFPFLFTGNGGAPQAQTQGNLNRLNKIIELAESYGITVTLLNYHSSWSLPGKELEREFPADLIQKNRDSILQLFQDCPKLAGLGFRVGESGQNEDFYREAYLLTMAGMKAPPDVSVLSWLSDTNTLIQLLNSYPGKSSIQVKWNGDHFGAPYPAVGNRFQEWHTYSYENAFQRPRRHQVHFQINSGGGNRLFPWGNYDWMKKAIDACVAYSADGICLFPIGSDFLPVDNFTNASFVDLRYYEWTYERDWHWYLLWGRLAYQTDTSSVEFQSAFERHFGKPIGDKMYQALNFASYSVPSIAQAVFTAPDQRSYSIEFEAPLTVAQLLDAKPLDELSVRSVKDQVAVMSGTLLDGRISPNQILAIGTESAQKGAALAEESAEHLNSQSFEGDLESSMRSIQREVKSWLMDFQALSALTQYYRDGVQAAIHLGLFQQNGDVPSLLIASELTESLSSHWHEYQKWTELHYRPLLDSVRNQEKQFHWHFIEPKVGDDLQAITQEYQDWQQAGNWASDFGHLRLVKIPPKKPVVLSVSFPPDYEVPQMYAHYQNSLGLSDRLNFSPSTVDGVYAVQIAPEVVTNGVFQYFLTAEIDGAFQKVPAEEGRTSFIVAASADERSPNVIQLNHVLADDSQSVSVYAQLYDESGILAARLLWKPLPSDSEWSVSEMRLEGNAHAGTFPLTPAGAQYAVEVIDGVGNGKRYPDVNNGMPYVIVPAFAGE